MTEDTPPVETADQAFAEAKAGFVLGDIELFQNSTKRVFAADRMGIVWGTIDRTDPRIAIGQYSGAMRDIAIVLWLCVTPCRSQLTKEERAAATWTVERAEREPEAAYEAAQDWLVSIGVKDNGTPEFNAAFDVMRRIKRGEALSRFRVTTGQVGAPTEEPDTGNSKGQPNAPPS